MSTTEKEKKMTFDGMPGAIADISDRISEIENKIGALNEGFEDIRCLLMNTPVASNRRPINIDRASEITGKAVTTLYRYVGNGMIPSYKRGRKLYFFEDELLDWLKKGKIKEIGERCSDVDKTIIQLTHHSRRY